MASRLDFVEEPAPRRPRSTRMTVQLAATAMVGIVGIVGALTASARGSGNNVVDAAKSTEEAGIAHVALTAMFESPDFPAASFTVSGQGSVDYRLARAQLTLSFPGGRPFEYIADGNMLYLKGDDGRFAPVGDHLVDGYPVGTFGPFAATGALQTLEAAGPVERKGTDVVRGDPTIRYDFVVASTPASVWVDSAGRMRRLRRTLDVTPAGGSPVRASVTVELFDSGAVEAIAAPS